MTHELTASDIREIYEADGFDRAEFIIEQSESQLGRDALKAARDELERLFKADFA